MEIVEKERSWQDIFEWPSTLLGERGWGACQRQEEEGETVLLIDLPGAKHEDVSLGYEGGSLQLRAERNGKSSRMLRRSISLPGIDPNGIRAHLENGLLEIYARHGGSAKEIEIS